MAREVYHRDLGNGTAQVFYDDGSTVIFDITTGQQVVATGPDQNIASAIRYGSEDDVQREIDRNIRIAEAIDRSVIGQREREARQAAIDRYQETRGDRNSQFDRNYDLQRDQFAYRREYDDRSLDMQEREADRRFGLDERRFGLDERRFGLDEKRFGLDQGRFGADLLRTDIEARNNPASWLRLAQWETGLNQQGLTPYALQALEQGKITAPSFNARQGTPGVVGLSEIVSGLQAGRTGAANAGPAPAGGGPAGAVAGPGASYVTPSQTGGAKTTAQQDPRVAAVTAALKNAPPPSEGTGLSAEDTATVDLISRIYSAGAHKSANSWGGLGADVKDIFRGGVAGVGGSPRAWEEQIQATRWRPGSILAS